jgi:ATP-binding cassette subfamily C protein CydC
MREVLRLLGLFVPYWKWMAGGLVLSVITFLADVGLMALSGWFIASMAVAGLTGVPLNYFTPAAAIRSLAICRTLARYLERMVTHETAFRLLARLRVWFYDRLDPLVPARVQAYRSGDLLSRLIADIDALDNFYVRQLTPTASAIVGCTVCVLFLSRYSVNVALVTLIFLFLAGAVVAFFLHRLGTADAGHLVEISSHLRSQVIDGLQGMGELRVYQAAERQARSIEEGTRDVLRCQAKMSRLNGFSEGAVGLCANLALWFSIILLVPLTARGELRGAELALITFFTVTAFEAVAPLPRSFQMLGHTLEAARRVFTLADAQPEVREPDRPSHVPERFSIEFRDLMFRYSTDSPWILKHINLKIEEGRRLALIGPTGSGKTTLAHLLLRFWEYEEGEIILGGCPLRSYQSSDVRRKVAVVSQDTHLFNTTVRENIMIANLSASEEQIVQAAKAAQIHDFVRSLPEGYNTFVGEAGIKLSAGQARRLTIARAILRDAPAVILDEPTEGLDPETESQVMKTLFTLMEGRTVLLITHRLVGLEAVDEVVMLEGGQIVERGRHADLIQKNSHYRRYHDLLSFEIDREGSGSLMRTTTSSQSPRRLSNAMGI